MIHLVLGKQGDGKTLFLVKKAYEKYRKGYTVYSNVHLNFPYKHIKVDDIINCKLQNGVVIWDEIHIHLPARRSLSKTNVKICDGFLSMVRKKNLEIFGSTQTTRKVDVRFRDEADYLYQCKKQIMYKNTFVPARHDKEYSLDTDVYIKLTIAEKNTEDFFTMQEEVKYIYKRFKANPYYNLYDSKQIIKIEGLD